MNRICAVIHCHDRPAKPRGGHYFCDPCYAAWKKFRKLHEPEMLRDLFVGFFYEHSQVILDTEKPYG